MTKEELEKEAEDYADKHAFRVPYDGSNKFYNDVDYKASKEGYLAGAEPREKHISDLEAQIEKMKCCFNCKHSRTEYEHCKTDKHEKWEIKEK